MKFTGFVRAMGMTLGWALGLVLALPANLPAQETALPDLEKRFRQAVRDGDLYTTSQVMDQLVALGTPQAIDVLLDFGLTQDRSELEHGILTVLSKLDSATLNPYLYGRTHEHPDHRVRILLTLAMATRSEPEALRALLTNLYDRNVSVVLTVVDVVRKRDERGAPVDPLTIDTLIEALVLQEAQGGGGHRLLKIELRRTLTQLTGTDLTEGVDWRNFWEPRKDNFERPDPKDRSKALTGVRTDRPEFFGVEVADNHVVFLLDISGSMKKKDPLPEEEGDPDGGVQGPSTGVVPRGEKKKKGGKDDEGPDGGPEVPDSRMRLTRVQTELVRVLSELPSDTKFTIITFNHLIGHFQPKLVSATPRNKELAIRFVRGFRPEGETYTDEALRAAFDVEEVTTIFLLSDGAPYRQLALEVDPILKEVREVNRFRRIRIHTVGFLQAGSNLRKFLTRLAGQNQGTYTELR